MKDLSLRRKLRRVVFALLVCAACSPSHDASAWDTSARPSQEQEQKTREVEAAKPAKKRGQSVLRGRVLYADTKRPVRRAHIVVMRLDHLFRANKKDEEAASAANESSSSPVTVVTNARGEFSVKNLVAGHYAVNVSASGIVSTGNFLNPGQYVLSAVGALPERLVELDGANEVEKEILVERGGAISGRVFYADGEPATNVSVALYCRVKDELVPCGIGGASTDDRGYYRFEGLVAGEYAAGASEQNISGNEHDRSAQDFTTFTGAYHPASRSLRRAETVRVETGRETEDVDITFGDETLRRVSGVVRWRHDNRPVRRALIRLRRAESPEAGAQPSSSMMLGAAANPRYAQYAVRYLGAGETRSAWTDEEGRWSFGEVPDGSYVVHVMVSLERKTPQASQAPSGEASRSQKLTVSGGDVTDFQVLMTEGGRVSGTVTVEGGGQVPASSVYVTATPLSGFAGSLGYSLPQVVRPDGTFMVEGVTPGEVSLDVYVGSQHEDGLYLKSVTGPNGVDLMRSTLRVAEDAEVGGVRVVLGSDSATLTGRVRAEGGAVFGTMLLIVAADSGLWAAPRRTLFAYAAADGSFHVSCPPGDYLIIPLRGGAGEYNSLLDFVAARAAHSLRVTLRPNERKSVEVSVPEDDED